MKKNKIKIMLLLFISLVWGGCSSNYPVDEDGLLITGRAQCYVSNFELLGVDHVSVIQSKTIDTTQCTIKTTLYYGTDLKNLYPQFTLATDAKLDPKITGITNFSATINHKQYTVVSGNRKIRKTYTIYISVQKPI